MVQPLLLPTNILKGLANAKTADEANETVSYPSITTGESATTGITPTKAGNIFITTGGDVYIAKAATADTDWVKLN